MDNKNIVFIATSIDGFIADRNGEIDWLHSIPNPDNEDMGYNELTGRIDALVMGRKTFETVCGFDMDWPYTKPVFVLSDTLDNIPKKYENNAQLVQGTLKEILEQIHKNGYHRLYIDGGVTIQRFLKEDLIDEMIITIIPMVLGGGVPLFGDLSEVLRFECIHSQVFKNGIVQNHFQRKIKG